MLTIIQCAASVHQIKSNQDLKIRAKFRELISDTIKTNFDKLITYNNSINPEVKNQDLIVNDQIVLMEQVNKLNNKQLSSLYQNI